MTWSVGPLLLNVATCGLGHLFGEILLSQAKTMRVDQQVNLFTAGLTESLQLEVEMQNPPNLVTAMNLARAFERKDQLGRTVCSRRNNWHNAKSAPTTFSSKPQSGSTISGSSSSTPPFKKLSRMEMADRRSKGLCYNCDELYSPVPMQIGWRLMTLQQP